MKFTVVRHQDAWVNYEAEIEADSPQEAYRLARADAPGIVWSDPETQTFDHADFDVFAEGVDEPVFESVR